MPEDDIPLPFDREDDPPRRLWHCSSCDFSWTEEMGDQHDKQGDT